MDELKRFAAEVAKALNIDSHISEIRIAYKKDFYNYYPKGKPFGGFDKLWDGNIAKLDLTKFWDINVAERKAAIVHELTHVRQLISRDLEVIGDKTIVWKGQVNHTWKVFRDSILESIITTKERDKYINLCFPWENEVTENIKKFKNL